MSAPARKLAADAEPPRGPLPSRTPGGIVLAIIVVPALAYVLWEYASALLFDPQPLVADLLRRIAR